MEKQQTLRRKVAGATSSCAVNQARKSLATQPREGAPHRVLELRNQILARANQPPPAPAADGRSAPAPATGGGRKHSREP
jgi:hypothetical protein